MIDSRNLKDLDHFWVENADDGTVAFTGKMMHFSSRFNFFKEMTGRQNSSGN